MAAREAAGLVIGQEAFGRGPKHRDPVGIYRLQAECFGGRSDGKFGARSIEVSLFQVLISGLGLSTVSEVRNAQ